MNDHSILDLPEMDAQHDYLYSLFDRIEPASTDHATLKHLLTEIERYLLFHFSCEVHLMRMYGYEGFAMHQADHEQAGNRFIAFLDDFENSRLDPAAVRIFLTGWLEEHSRISDSDYVKRVKERRIRIFS
ncbi:MAG: hemerythrin family protein [Chitinispirillaceae bacterium]|nr:hemerythrin family protein [Chitinispirillaceae bacterium]